MTFVLDNSATLAWCFKDEWTPGIVKLLDRLTEDGATAPQLWPLETMDGLLTAERRGRITGAERQRLIEFLRALPIEIDDQMVSQVWTATAQLADQHRLSIYDATFLELALRLGLPLATADRALLDAAQVVRVPVLSAD